MYPKLQQEATYLRDCKREQDIESSKKRGRPKNDSPLRKRSRTDTKWTRIAGREDVPQDVKELIDNYKKETYNMKQKVARLETRVAVTKDKLNKKAVAAAKPAPVVLLPPVTAPTKPRTPPKPIGPPATFESRFKELEDFQRANNHTRVPGRIPGLGRW
jgi:hypothetical protein